MFPELRIIVTSRNLEESLFIFNEVGTRNLTCSDWYVSKHVLPTYTSSNMEEERMQVYLESHHLLSGLRSTVTLILQRIL